MSEALNIGILLTLARHHAEKALECSALSAIMREGEGKASRIIAGRIGQTNGAAAGMSDHDMNKMGIKLMDRESLDHLGNLIHVVKKIEAQMPGASPDWNPEK